MSEKKFVGKMETVPMEGSNGPWEKTTISLNKKDLLLLNENTNENGYVKILVQKSKATGKPYMIIDEYVPVKKADFEQTRPQDQPGGYQSPPPNMNEPEGLPF